MKRAFDSNQLSFFRASKRTRSDSLETQPPTSDSEVSELDYDIRIMNCCMCYKTDAFDSLDGAYENGWFVADAEYCPEHAFFGILLEDGELGKLGIGCKELAQVYAVLDEVVSKVVSSI